MVSLLRKLMILPLLLLAGLATAQQVDIEVDRDELARGETLTLTIRLPLTRQLASRHARLRDTLPHRALGPGVVAAMGDAVHGGAAVAGHLRLVLLTLTLTLP